MAEHKLTAKGLVDPETAKKLGMFAGVDALILGTMTPKGSNMSLTAKIITTETAEIIGAAKGEFKTDATTQQLVSHAAADTTIFGGSGNDKKDSVKATKTFEDMRVDIDSVQIVNGQSGPIFQVAMSLSNTNAKRSIWVALSADLGGTPKSSLRDSSGYEFSSDWSGVSGIPPTALQYDGFFKASEIKPGETLAATVKFGSRGRKEAAPGSCNVQIELLMGYNYDGQFGKAKVKTLMAKVNAE